MTDDSPEPTGDGTRQLKDHERAVPVSAFNKIENKLLRAERKLRKGRTVDAHEEVTDAHRELSQYKEDTDEELVADGGRTVATNRTTRDADIDGSRTVATNRTTRDASIDDEPRWRFEWRNIRDGAGVFVR